MRRISQRHSGSALLIVILVIAVVLVAAFLFIEGYIRHVKEAALMYDQETVYEAEDMAAATYLADGCPPEGVIYYYDDLTKQCYDASKYGWRINIDGYGRTSEEDNAHMETGAKGIPNKGDDGGAQFLAIFVIDRGETVISRWQGQILTAYDYSLMTEDERNLLTEDQLKQIEYMTEAEES